MMEDYEFVSDGGDSAILGDVDHRYEAAVTVSAWMLASQWSHCRMTAQQARDFARWLLSAADEVEKAEPKEQANG